MTTKTAAHDYKKYVVEANGNILIDPISKLCEEETSRGLPASGNIPVLPSPSAPLGPSFRVLLTAAVCLVPLISCDDTCFATRVQLSANVVSVIAKGEWKGAVIQGGRCEESRRLIRGCFTKDEQARAEGTILLTASARHDQPPAALMCCFFLLLLSFYQILRGDFFFRIAAT